MRSRHLSLIAVFAAVASSCLSSTEPWAGWDTRAVTFTNRYRFQRGGSACVNSPDVYCATSVADSFQTDGLIHQKGDSLVLDAFGHYEGHLDSRGDSVVAILSAVPYSACANFDMTLKLSDISVAGSFFRSTDCHGLGHGGTVSGR